MTKRILSALILCSFILAQYVSCAEKDVSAEESTESFAAAETEAEELTDGLDGFDFDGGSFTIVYSEDQLGSEWPYDAEEENGDILNDCVYKRNLAVEERLNVVINYQNTGGTSKEVPSALLKSVSSGDGAYQLAISHTFSSVPSLLSVGALSDFASLPNIDLDKPWWNSSIRNNLSLLGMLPVAVSDLIYSYADVIYVNRDLLAEYGLEDTYSLVEDGSWTWTKLAQMAKSVTSDLDGDGENTLGDRFGFTFPGETPSLMSRMIHSDGMQFAAVDGGSIELLGMSERLQNTLERYFELIYGGDTYLGTVTDKQTSVEAFCGGNILFMHQTTLQLPKMRDTDVNFGIVPLPKYDEEQENYRSMLSSQILLAPNVKDGEAEFIGTVTEALSYESWKTVTPAVYDSIFESKYLRDATSYDMYSRIRDSLVCDFNWNYGDGNNLTYIVSNLIFKEKSTDAASYLAKYEPSIKEAYEKLFDSVRDAYGIE